METSTSILLKRAREGDQAANAALIDSLYTDLKKLAARFMKSERPNHTLQPTALVNEVYQRVFLEGRVEVRDRSHFMTLAGQAMRRVLVDHARRRKAAKRPVTVSFEEIHSAFEYDPELPNRYLEIDQALERLSERDARLCQVVEMRFFAGLTEGEIAEALGVSERTVKRDWKFARAWLEGELGTTT